MARWQELGIGVYWEEYQKLGVNPKTGSSVSPLGRRLKRDLDVPMKGACSECLAKLLSAM